MDVEHTFREHGDDLFRYLARQCGDPQLAKDAVQETFVRLQRTPPDHGSIRGWLFRTGMNVIRDVRKVEANRRRILESNPHRLPQPGPPPSPEDRAQRQDDLRRLRRALDSLRERERDALLLREAGFKHREIAEELGTTTKSVGTLIARSLVKLESAFQSEGGTA